MKLNHAMLFGLIVTEPVVMVDNENRVSYVKLRLLCINNTARPRGKREGKDFDFVLIKCENPDICKNMAQAEIGDFCCASGVVAGDFATRKYHCPVCGRDISKEGTYIYIVPKMFNIIYKGYAIDDDGRFSNDKANEILMPYREESNHLFLSGMVQRDPIPYKTNEMGVSRCAAYQLAVRRKYRIKRNDGSDDVNCDFPYVKTWGKQAKKAMLFIQPKTTVLVDGFLRARKFDKYIQCPCGNMIEKNSASSDIAAYDQEFISNVKEKDTTDMAAINKNRILISSEDDETVVQNRITEEDKADVKDFYENMPKYTVPDEDEKKHNKEPVKTDSSGETATLEQLKHKYNQ